MRAVHLQVVHCLPMQLLQRVLEPLHPGSSRLMLAPMTIHIPSLDLALTGMIRLVYKGPVMVHCMFRTKPEAQLPSALSAGNCVSSTWRVTVKSQLSLIVSLSLSISPILLVVMNGYPLHWQ